MIAVSDQYLFWVYEEANWQDFFASIRDYVLSLRPEKRATTYHL